jgi:hypothetical protein
MIVNPAPFPLAFAVFKAIYASSIVLPEPTENESGKVYEKSS